MAPKTATDVKTAACACGCGETVTRHFKQGHDQKMISEFAHNTVTGDGRCRGILTVAQSKGDIEVRIGQVRDYIAKKLSEGLAAKYENAALRQWEFQKAREAKVEARAARVRTAPKSRTKKAAPSEEAGSAPDSRVGQVVTAKASNDDVDAAEAEQDSPLGLGVPVRAMVKGRARNGKVGALNQSGKMTVFITTRAGKDTRHENTEGFEVVN